MDNKQELMFYCDLKYQLNTAMRLRWTRLLLLPAHVDLIDLDGQVTNLSEHSKEYAYPYVGSRSTYILVRVESEYQQR